MNTSFDIYELNNAVMDAAKTIKDMRNRIEIHGGGNSYIMEDFQMLRYLEQSDDKSKVFSKGKGHKESIQTFLTYVKGESNNPYTWLELKSVAKAAIYSQNFMNSGSQHSIFS